MGLNKVDAFTLDCDRCEKVFENPFEGFSIFSDEEYCMQEATEDGGWHHDEDNNKFYCDKCHHIDEEDNVIIHEPIVKHNG